MPGWMRLARMWSEHAQREIDYFIADDVETLLFIIDLGTIALHIHLDPRAQFGEVVAIALEP